jgi:cobalamin transport system substrate-binding protein
MAARSTPGPARPRAPHLFSLVALLALLGCGPAATASDSWTYGSPTVPTVAPPSPSPTPMPAFPVTLTDDEGTKVTIPSEPLKIVSLTPSATEILFAIGAGDRVVAKVEDIAKFPPEADDVPVVATFAGVDVEEIVSLEPDLVISGGAGFSQGPAVEQLRRATIPVIVNYPTTVGAGLAGIRLIGQAVGEADAATELADSMQARIDALSGIAAKATTKPRLFYEIDVTGGIFTPPAESIFGEMFRLAGAEPISGNASYSISLEDLVAADPEVILLGDTANGVTADAVAKRPGWTGMAAVKAGRIYPIDDIIVTRPGPRIVDGLEALIRAIHPELADQLPSPSAGPSAPPSAGSSGAAVALPLAA